MELKLTLNNAAKLIDTFNRAPEIARKEYLISLERVAAKVVSEAKRNSPVGKGYSGGGNLRQSINYVQNGGSGFVVWVNAEYGVYVDQGTRPHLILPRTKKMLAFQINGKWVFAKRVNHPGTKAQPFFTNAVAEGERYANVEMEAAADRVISQIQQ
jgi:HK97 gp10 family phage protein